MHVPSPMRPWAGSADHLEELVEQQKITNALLRELLVPITVLCRHIAACRTAAQQGLSHLQALAFGSALVVHLLAAIHDVLHHTLRPVGLIAHHVLAVLRQRDRRALQLRCVRCATMTMLWCALASALCLRPSLLAAACGGGGGGAGAAIGGARAPLFQAATAWLASAISGVTPAAVSRWAWVLCAARASAKLLLGVVVTAYWLLTLHRQPPTAHPSGGDGGGADSTDPLHSHGLLLAAAAREYQHALRGVSGDSAAAASPSSPWAPALAAADLRCRAAQPSHQLDSPRRWWDTFTPACLAAPTVMADGERRHHQRPAAPPPAAASAASPPLPPWWCASATAAPPSSTAPATQTLDVADLLLRHAVVDGVKGAACVWLLGGSARGWAVLWLLWCLLLARALHPPSAALQPPLPSSALTGWWGAVGLPGRLTARCRGLSGDGSSDDRRRSAAAAGWAGWGAASQEGASAAAWCSQAGQAAGRAARHDGSTAGGGYACGGACPSPLGDRCSESGAAVNDTARLAAAASAWPCLGAAAAAAADPTARYQGGRPLLLPLLRVVGSPCTARPTPTSVGYAAAAAAAGFCISPAAHSGSPRGRWNSALAPGQHIPAPASPLQQQQQQRCDTSLWPLAGPGSSAVRQGGTQWAAQLLLLTVAYLAPAAAGIAPFLPRAWLLTGAIAVGVVGALLASGVPAAQSSGMQKVV